MNRLAPVATAALLALTGCTAADSTETATAAATGQATTSGGLTLLEAKTGYLWNATVAAPSLATMRGKTLIHFGQDVCNDLSAKNWPRKSWASYTQHYDLNARQTTALIHAAAGFLCPEFQKLVELP